MQPILTDNHQSDVVIFSKKWKGGADGCRGYLARYPSPPKMLQAHRCVGGPKNHMIWYFLRFRCMLKHRSDFSQLPRSSSVRAIQTRCVLTRREDEALAVHGHWSQPHISLSRFLAGFGVCSSWWWDLLHLFGQLPFVPESHNPGKVLPFGAWSTEAPFHGQLKCQLKKLLHSSFQRPPQPPRGIFAKHLSETRKAFLVSVCNHQFPWSFIRSAQSVLEHWASITRLS